MQKNVSAVGATAGRPYKFLVIPGSSLRNFPHFVENKRIDLVMIGTVGRSGIKGFFMGNTAEKVLNNINCSVLTIKPHGWKTPV